MACRCYAICEIHLFIAVSLNYLAVPRALDELTSHQEALLVCGVIWPSRRIRFGREPQKIQRVRQNDSTCIVYSGKHQACFRLLWLPLPRSFGSVCDPKTSRKEKKPQAIKFWSIKQARRRSKGIRCILRLVEILVRNCCYRAPFISKRIVYGYEIECPQPNSPR